MSALVVDLAGLSWRRPFGVTSQTKVLAVVLGLFSHEDDRGQTDISGMSAFFFVELGAGLCKVMNYSVVA